jgi:hypothetical protein
MKSNRTQEVLYHFTCQYNLSAILQKRYLTLSESNFSFEKAGLYPVVWLTDLPAPDNMGLLFDKNIPDDLNKTHIRVTIKKKSYMKKWDEWSDLKGMDKNQKQFLIGSAGAEDTYKSWYVSEQIIPINDVMIIENIVTGKIYYKK